ncbi:MAG: sigma-70 family RNA polymerase sigma factor [Chthoniobacterales bacterium]|jgi:RNA polymerase sigma-70 factor (ECF subfamily)|nr:sigma-70 family RNA polymerase sigma factor [Chthoniobacterales bacterium]
MQDLPAPHIFATTRWSLVLSGAEFDGGETKPREALDELCRTYWRPIFSFVCRRGYSNEDAQDLTQDFFVMILEKNWLQQADRDRGRFRSFLLKSVQHFLGHDLERRQAQKRGGGLHLVPWEEWMAEAASQESSTNPAWAALSPEVFFDLRWATTVVDQALRRLREECEAKGKLRLFEALRDHLAAERTETSYAALATSLSIAETMVKKQLHNLRQRYRWLLRDEVAHTVENEAEVEEEIRYLCATLAAMT